MKTFQVSLYGWAETNTNWLNPDTQHEYRERSTRTFKTAKSVFSTSSMPSSSHYKPGGTATTLIGKWSGRAEHNSGMGCWSYYLTLKGKNNVVITIIMAYRVSQLSMPKMGDITTYHQENAMVCARRMGMPHAIGFVLPSLVSLHSQKIEGKVTA